MEDEDPFVQGVGAPGVILFAVEAIAVVEVGVSLTFSLLRIVSLLPPGVDA